MGLESFWAAEHLKRPENGTAREGMKTPRPSSHLAPCMSSIGLFLSCSLSNKPVIISQLFF